MSHKTDLLEYRRSKARETLADAQTLLDSKSFSSAVNRIYYALFYEVTALLLTKDLSSAKHSGTRSLFNDYFIKTGIVNSELGKFYSMMFEFRQKGDYGDFVSFEENRVREWLVRAGEVIHKLEALFEKSANP
jgi:uncharacterized protein (UPF0332 family)